MERPAGWVFHQWEEVLHGEATRRLVRPLLEGLLGGRLVRWDLPCLVDLVLEDLWVGRLEDRLRINGSFVSMETQL